MLFIMPHMRYYDYVNCLHTPIDKEQSIDQKNKGNTMGHYDNRPGDSSFVNRMQ